MPRLLLIPLLLAALAAAQVIDRIVATVNDRVVTRSDWEERARFDALLEGRPPESARPTPEVLERLIDQAMVREQLDLLQYTRHSPDEVAAQSLAIRAQLGVKDDAEWGALLRRYRLTEASFRRNLGERLEMLRFIDVRFRPSVQIAPREVEEYYSHVLIPGLSAKGTPPDQLPRLRDVEVRIEALLAERRLNQLFESWLQGLRKQARIQRFVTEP
jgi:parvulin-like peptidyl-prolyl isomerase